ncbi:hypothetical protein KC19_5G029000 [Ceratodon purpureus]|uniref:Uncharacterized protein n=1 Tax=Ceratodon purpureus TaxID=3225 RepID=A0A8T0HYM5_CERPU|nr:hypothetical protein KC19_5G029000 [Ceratodon purpureus]
MEEKAKPGLTAARAEELLVLCAKAIEKRDVTAAQQAVHALQSISSVDGELPSERVTAYFLRALMIRASSLLQSSQNLPPELDPAQYMQDNPHQVRWGERALGFNDLTHLVDMTPYYRFGYMAANGAILEAFEGMDRVHIVDFSTSHCMQWPTLIDSLADRMDGPPHVRLTVCTSTLPIPPRLHPSYKEVGHRLTLWAREKGVPFEFHILSRPLESLCISDMNLREGESLAVNCSLRLHYLGDETLGLGFGSCSPPSSSVSEGVELCARDKFLQLVACLNPAVLTLYEEDCNATSNDLVARLKESYNHEWIPFDYLATYAHHGRREHERDLGLKIENLVACEGMHRIERLESMSQWSQRLRRMNFRTLRVSDDVVTALREMVGDYSGGWGMKLEDDIQVLNWKGHSLAFASAWVPAPPPIKLSYSPY